MTARVVVEAAFLAVMLAAALLSVVGMLRSRDAFAAIHCASLASIVVPVTLVCAVAVAKLGSEATIKTAIVCAVSLIAAPIASHALGRAIFLRSRR